MNLPNQTHRNRELFELGEAKSHCLNVVYYLTRVP